MPELDALTSSALGDLNSKQLIVDELEITADASSGLAFNLTYPLAIVEVIARSTATVASATVQVSDGTNNITDAISIATIDQNNKAATIDTTYSSTAAVTLTTNSASDRALVYIIGRRTA